MVESAASDDLCTQNSPCTGITRNGLVEFHPGKFCISVWCGISLTIPMASNGIGNKGIPPSESSGPREQTRQLVLFATLATISAKPTHILWSWRNPYLVNLVRFKDPSPSQGIRINNKIMLMSSICIPSTKDYLIVIANKY